MRTVFVVTAFALCIYVLICLVMALQQRAIVYPATRTLETTPAALGLEYESVRIAVGAEESVHGWFLPQPVPVATVLFFHGNAGNISHRLNTLALFNRLGLQTLIIDYQGYGESTGTAGEEATYEDARAAWRWLVETQSIKPSTIIIFGRSLGGGVASALASEQSAGALVLDSTFLSVAKVARDHYPWLPVNLLLQIRYDTASRLRHISSRVIILHSVDDEIIDFYHGDALYKLASEPKRLVTMVGSHNALVANNHALYEQTLSQLIDELRAHSTD